MKKVTPLSRSKLLLVAAVAVLVQIVGSTSALRAQTPGAGPFSPDGGVAGSNGVAVSDPNIAEWASGVVSYQPGPDVITDPTGPTPTYDDPEEGLGPADATAEDPYSVVSLGNAGSITLDFSKPIANGPGADLAVYTNKFEVTANNYFLELATVAVSSDGVNFFTFPSVSLTQTTTQVGAFGTLDPTYLYNLAGSEIAGYGTPFNLDDLAGVSPLLNIDDVTEVRITDVIGNIDTSLGAGTYSVDDATDPIFDGKYGDTDHVINAPYPTDFGSSGFSLDAVAVLNVAAVPEPSTWALFAMAAVVLIFTRIRRSGALAVFAAAAMTGFAQADNIDFSSLTPTTPYTGPGGGDYTNDQAFEVQDVGFNNSYDSTYGSWAGFAYSNTTDQTTADFTNQYSAVGSGIPTYAVGYVDDFTPFDPTVTLAAGEQPTSLLITNTVYAALAIQNGSEFSTAFGPGDYFILNIEGLNSAGDSTGTVNFYLANYLSSNPADDYIVSNWTNVSLASLGAGTDQLVFTESSSDTGEFGINTPEYFALGGLQVAEAPEPSIIWFALISFAVLVVYKRRRV